MGAATQLSCATTPEKTIRAGSSARVIAIAILALKVSERLSIKKGMIGKSPIQIAVL